MLRRPQRWSRLLQRRLLVSLVLPGLIGLVLLALAIADLVGERAPAAVLLWVLPGVAVGYVLGRMTRVAWTGAGPGPPPAPVRSPPPHPAGVVDWLPSRCRLRQEGAL